MKKVIFLAFCCFFALSTQAFAFPKASNYDDGNIDENKAVTGYIYVKKGDNTVHIIESKNPKFFPASSTPISLATAGYYDDIYLGGIILKICPVGSKCVITGVIRDESYFTEITKVNRIK